MKIAALGSILILVITYFASTSFIAKNIASFRKNGTTKVLLTGDVMLGRMVMKKCLDNKDFGYPFMNVRNELNSADIVFANLENPIVENCPIHTDGLIFCAPPSSVTGLKAANIGVVNLANNHINNYGKKGVGQTIESLNKAGINYSGFNHLTIQPFNHVTFGFLGFDFVDKTPKDEDLALVGDSAKKVDVLIVSVHWGQEYRAVANDKQRRIARALVENGADVVVGHHPHWVQDVDYINGKPVYYSLGNFVFDQPWSEETKKGLVMKLTFKGDKLVKEEKMPVYIGGWGQPGFVLTGK